MSTGHEVVLGPEPGWLPWKRGKCLSC